LYGNIFPLFKEKAIEPLFALEFVQALHGIIAGLLITAPHLLQVWAIHTKNLKATNRGIKVLCLYWTLVAVPFFGVGFAFFYAEEVYALCKKSLQIAQEQIPNHPILPLPPFWELRGRAWNGLQLMGKPVASFVVEYFAARKFRNYVIEREKFLKKNE